jgi:uncharacterized membrane protein YozB (DUF420 family)
MRPFDDATAVVELESHSGAAVCTARREWGLVTAVLAFAQLVVGVWWIARSHDAAGGLRLILVAAYLPPSVWMMIDGWRRYRR